MSAYVYAKVNKDTLRFIRTKKQVSFDYIERLAKFSEEKINIWEDVTSNKLPTINQAKRLSQCYRVPFAGFYMNSEDINVNHLPKMINKRTMREAIEDDTEVNLALIDLINERNYYVETKKLLHETIPFFDLRIHEDNSVLKWAEKIRAYFEIDLKTQYKLTSARQLYLYLRKKMEIKGLFIQSFQKTNLSVLRGVAIIDDSIPIIGINEEDRYPAKSFSAIHELVHVIKRSSAICNDMCGSDSIDKEEVFCNAVAGEVLVPSMALDSFSRKYSEFTLKEIDNIAKKFSVSSEVIARRLFDTKKINRKKYEEICDELINRFNSEREKLKSEIKMGIVSGPQRNMAREAIDRTSSMLSDVMIRGYAEGIIDKSDISAHVGIGMKHINKFIMEVMGWQM